MQFSDFRASLQKIMLAVLLLGLFTGCSQVAQIPENESELFQSLRQDRFDDGYTPIMDKIETPLYDFGTDQALHCGLRALRATPRKPDVRFLQPVEYYLKCRFTNRQGARLDKVTDEQNKPLKIAYSDADVFSDGKKNSTTKITLQEFLITLNQESLVQCLRQNANHRLTLKSTDPNQKDLYLNGIQIDIPARLLKSFYTFSAVTWPEARQILE